MNFMESFLKLILWTWCPLLLGAGDLFGMFTEALDHPHNQTGFLCLLKKSHELDDVIKFNFLTETMMAINKLNGRPISKSKQTLMMDSLNKDSLLTLDDSINQIKEIRGDDHCLLNIEDLLQEVSHKPLEGKKYPDIRGKSSIKRSDVLVIFFIIELYLVKNFSRY